MNLTELFCYVDDFCQKYEPLWEKTLINKNGGRRAGRLTLSERMTIMIHFHQSHYRDFKAYYQEHVTKYLLGAFPDLVSYPRFVALMPRMFIPLCAFLHQNYGTCTGISSIDSTSLAVCHNKRIRQHRVFAGLARRGKTTMGWFFGFKVHLVINDRGEILACQITQSNVDDRKQVPKLDKSLWGELFGDKGYISKKLFASLWEEDVQLITRLRRNMKQQLLPLKDRLLLRKRAIIETVNDQLKNISQKEHTRHRSPTNYFVNVISGLIAYCFQLKKPSIHSKNELHVSSYP